MSYSLSNQNIKDSDSLIITLIPIKLEFVANSYLAPFSSNLYATSCDKGYGGMKYPITSINIYSNNDFNDSLKAGSDLSSIFYIERYLGMNNIVYSSLIPFQIDNKFGQRIRLLIKIRPTRSRSHKLKVLITKSNNEVIEIETVDIDWD